MKRIRDLVGNKTLAHSMSYALTHFPRVRPCRMRQLKPAQHCWLLRHVESTGLQRVPVVEVLSQVPTILALGSFLRSRRGSL